MPFLYFGQKDANFGDRNVFPIKREMRKILTAGK
jgi:hypothetical protein